MAEIQINAVRSWIDIFAYHRVEFVRGIEGKSAHGLHQVIVIDIEVQALERCVIDG